MKAIVVRQPYAALIVAGTKTIETRPAPPNGPMRPQGVRGLPGLPIEPGERIAICAAAAKPKEGWRASPGLRGDAVYADMGGEWVVSGGRLHELCDEVTLSLPLGAVIGTVVVTEAPPMVGRCPAGISHAYEGAPVWNGWRRIFTERPGELLVTRHRSGPPADITDQLPLGEFAPGRWGWLLADPTPCTPVPVTGKQGVFMLPDAVAEQVTA